MLVDDLMPEFDAARIEHRVIDASTKSVYRSMVHTDLAAVFGRTPVVRVLFRVRAAGERLVELASGSGGRSQQPELVTMRLDELPDHGDWVRLGEDPPNEFVFGAVGRFWSAGTTWAQIDSSEFGRFEDPGYAKIVASLSVHPYGNKRALLIYEARTRATDAHARRAFLRYWKVVSPGVGIVMRSALALIEDEARAQGASR